MSLEIDNLEIKISSDSSKAAENVLALANSLSKLAGKTPTATANLTNLSRAIKSISGITKVGKLTESVEEISSAINKLNNITASDNIKNIADSLSSLSSVSKTLGEFKIGKSLSNSVDILAETIPKLNAIGSVENSVELLDSVGNILQATTDFKQISDNINGLQIGKSFLTNLENLSFIIEYLNSIEDTGKFTEGVSNIAKAIGIFNSIEVNPAVASLARIAPVMEDVSTALQSASSATVRFENLTTGLAKFAAGLSSISFTNTENIQNIVNGLNKFNEIGIDESVTKSMNAIAKAVNSISNAKWNESAADNLRYFIDTLRILTDEDVYRLENLATVLSSLKGAKGIDISLFEESTNTTAQTTGIEKVSNEYKHGTNILRIFGTVLKGVGTTALFVANSGFKVLEASAQTLATVSKGAFTAISAAVKGVFSPVTSMAKKFKEASAGLGTFLASIKRVAMYRLIRTALKAISDGIRVGRENLYQYSLVAGTQFAKSMDMAATAALYLKNSIGAATAPLTNYFVPIIDKVVDRVVELINKFNELTAVLTGADSWTKALKYPVQWKDAAEDANKSAKQLKSTMLGFDELNVIEPSSNGSKSKLEDALDYSKMFEEVKTDMMLNSNIPDLLLPVKMAWDAEGDNTLQSIKRAWENILGLVGAVHESFSTVWQNGTGQRTLELLLQTVQNISDALGNAAKRFKEAWNINEKGTKIVQRLWNIANNTIEAFKKIWGYISEFTNNLDFNPLLYSFEKLLIYVDELTSSDYGGFNILRSIFHDVLLPLGKFTIEDALPASIELFTKSLETLHNIFEYIFPDIDKFTEIINNTFIGAFDAAYSIVSDVITTLDENKDTLKSVADSIGNILGLFSGIVGDIVIVATNGSLKETMQSVLNITESVVGTFGNLAESIKAAWDEGDKGKEILQSVWDIANNLLTVFGDIWDSLSEWASNLNWQPLLDSLGDLYDSIDDLTNPESGAMQLLKKLFSEVLEPIGTWTIETALPVSIDAVTAAVDALNSILDTINTSEALGKLADGLKQITSFTFENIASLVDSLTVLTAILSGRDVSDSVIDRLENSIMNSDSNPIAGAMDKAGQKLFDFVHEFDLDAEGLFKDEEGGIFTGIRKLIAALNPVQLLTELSAENLGEKVGTWVRENVVDPIWNTLSAIINFPADLGEKVGEKVPELWEKLKGAIKDAFGIKNNSSSKTKDLGKDVSNGMKNGIAEPFNNISNWIQTKIFDPFVDGFKSIFKIGSPSKVMEEQGGFISDGLLNGIKRKFSLSSMTEWVRSNLFDPFKNALTNTFGINKTGESDTGKSVGSSIISGIKSVFSTTDFSDYTKYGEGITEGIGSGFTSTFDSNISGKVSEKRDLLKSFFRKDEFTDSGRNIVSGIGDGFNNNYDDSIGQWVLQKVGWIKNAFSREEFTPIGGEIADGIGEGIKNSNSISDALGSLKKFFFGDEETGEKGFFSKNRNLQLNNIARHSRADIGTDVTARSESRMAAINGNTITAGMAEAVYRAMMQAAQQNSNGETTIPNINLYIDRKELTTQIEAQQKSNGVKILGTVAYQ